MPSPSVLQTLALGLSALATFSNAAPSSRSFFDSRDLTFDYNSNKIYGVNLGGWLVTEPWITPTLFERAGEGAIDEYTLCETMGKDAALSLLSAHWASFVGADDLTQIAAAGMNHVRIPVGYWSVAPVEGEPYVQGALEYLDKAIGWAGAAGLRVIIDLHGGAGSQNGFDNSGRRDDVGWGSGDTVTKTLEAISLLAKRYAGFSSVVTGIELLNEPFPPGVDLDVVRQFYGDGFGKIREVNPDTVVVMSDAFQSSPSWNGFFPGNNLMIDTHMYQMFVEDTLREQLPESIRTACSKAEELGATDKWTVVGEWTGARTDCTKWLNGRGRGARFNGTFAEVGFIGSCDGLQVNSVASLSAEHKANTRKFIEAQLDTYDRRTGWFFWTWKTESSAEWDMQALIAGGIFPQPLTDRQYPGQCAA